MKIALVWWGVFGIYLLFFILWKNLKNPEHDFLVAKRDCGWFNFISSQNLIIALFEHTF